MSQIPSYPCPRCGTPNAAGQQFCARCGVPLNTENYAQQVTPPANAYAQTPQALPYPAYPQQGYATPPTNVKPQKEASRGVLKQIGCGVGLVILLILLVLGTAGYFVVRYIGSHATNGSNSSADATPTQAPVTTTPINTTVTYASVAITIVNAQQATSFANDSSTSSPGAVRLNLNESQSVAVDTNGGSNVDPYYDYGKGFNLLLPGGKSVAPQGTQKSAGPTKGGSQNNWIDFPVPTSMKVNQLILRIGTEAQTQMDIPLTGHADISQYQPKTVSSNVKVSYGGMAWTLTTATAQLSDGGTQADNGKRFIVVVVKVDNPTSQDVNAYPPDYVRLQVGGTRIAPTNYSIPTAFATGTTNTKGVASFLVPQHETAFTLVLLANGSTGADKDASIDFQIQ